VIYQFMLIEIILACLLLSPMPQELADLFCLRQRLVSMALNTFTVTTYKTLIGIIVCTCCFLMLADGFASRASVELSVQESYQKQLFHDKYLPGYTLLLLAILYSLHLQEIFFDWWKRNLVGEDDSAGKRLRIVSYKTDDPFTLTTRRFNNRNDSHHPATPNTPILTKAQDNTPAQHIIDTFYSLLKAAICFFALPQLAGLSVGFFASMCVLRGMLWITAGQELAAAHRGHIETFRLPSIAKYLRSVASPASCRFN